LAEFPYFSLPAFTLLEYLLL